MDQNQGLLAVDAVGLRKSFGGVRAVDGVDLSIRPGEIVAFLGPNGAGKTTTIGLAGLRERVAAAGGVLSVGRSDLGRARLRVRL
ncbi:ATP-binding cassette domain-containing protein [Microbacterium lacticum]